MSDDVGIFTRDQKDDVGDKDLRMIRMVRVFMDQSSRYRESHMELALQSRSLYENWKEEEGRSLTQRANLKLPFGYSVIETQIPQIAEFFLKDQEVIRYEGRGPEDMQWQDSLTDFTTQQLQEMQFSFKFISFIKSMLLDGTAFAKVPYRFIEQQVKSRVVQEDLFTGQPVVSTSEHTEVMFDGPDFELIPFKDFFPDWRVKLGGSIQDMRGCVMRTYRSLSELEESAEVEGGEGRYKNLDQLKMSVHKKGANAWKQPYFDSREDEFDRQNDNEEGIKNSDQIEIWEYWGLFDPAGNGKFEEWILTIANGDVVIRTERNFYHSQFKPFLACPNIVRDGEFYGLPELMSIKTLVKEANAIRNARLDNINISVNPMWLVDRASGINVRSLYSRPNAIIPTNDINGIKPLVMQDPSIASLTEMGNIQQDIQNATANIAATPGLTQAAKTFGRSATGVNFIQSFAMSRAGLKAKILSEVFFKRLGWVLLRTNRQFVTEDKWVRISSPGEENPFTLLPPDAFARNYDFVVETDLDNGGAEGQFAKMNAIAEVLRVFEQSQPGTVKTDVLLPRLLRPLLGTKIPNFIRSEEERQQMMVAQQQANAMAGAMAPQPNAGPPEPDLLGLLGG
jgi:hypothetical protein